MSKTRFALSICALILSAFAFTSAAYAQTAQRTFVSTQGDDSNTASLCGRNTPCRGFTAAISVVAAGGEVIALDSGGYGAVSINKSVQITAPTGVYVAITATSGYAIQIATGMSDTVVLRGLTLNGLGAQFGITFLSGRTLHVENCVINGFGNMGINVGRTSTDDIAEVFIKDTIVRNGYGGIGISLSNTGNNSFVRASIDNCRIERHNFSGVLIGANTKATVRHSVSANNGSGFSVAGQGSELNLENCVATNNNFAGLLAGGVAGAAGVIRVSNTTITNNSTGIMIDQSGQIFSRGNNTVEGNTNGNTFPAGSTYTAK